MPSDPPVRRLSLLQMSSAARLVWALAACALVWLVVAWALA